jgi:predicted secreted hydrolase
MKKRRYLGLMLGLSAMGPLKAQTGQQPRLPGLVRQGTTLSFPRDHGAHPEFRTEWWYVTGNLNTKGSSDAETIGFQLTFFRSAVGQLGPGRNRFEAKQVLIGHVAIAQRSRGQLLHEQIVHRLGFESITSMSETDCDLKIRSWQLKRSGQGEERYQASVETDQMSLSLLLYPQGPARAQGEKGFSQKGPSARQASYYYSRPQLKVDAQLTLKSSPLKRQQALSGSAWMDHEWSNEVLSEEAAGWDWMGLNFDNGEALMAFRIRPRQGEAPVWSDLRYFDRKGETLLAMKTGSTASERAEVFRIRPKRYWRSLLSNANYPVEMEIEIRSPSPRILTLRPLMDMQEIDARASTGGFYWEGLVFVFENAQRVGQGYLELTGYAAPMKL